MAEITAYKCPNCGADIPFDPHAENLKCSYCDTEFPVDTLKEYGSAIEEKSDTYVWQSHSGEKMDLSVDEYICPSCGGAVSMAEEKAAGVCPYCGSAIILNAKVEEELKPDIIIPFAIDKDEAYAALKKELSGKFLLPADFKNHRFLDKIQGLYVPYWLFDCTADCEASFRMTRTRMWSDGQYRYTKISHYLALRRGQMAFDKVPVDASLKLDEELLESIEPFDYTKAKAFDMAYLAQNNADIRQEEADACEPKANKRIHESMIAALQSTIIGYDGASLQNSHIAFNDGKMAYAFLPVYLLSRTYKNKVYTFAINGQSGKVAGDLPYDYPKLFLYGALVFIVSFLLIGALAYFFLV